MPNNDRHYFPPVEHADASGLLMVDGRLSPEWLLAAYRRGIFPWPIVERHFELLAWFSPDPRAILEFDAFHVSRRLARRLRSGEFQFTADQSFREVITACSAPRREDGGVWITRDIIEAYTQMHERGHAHSIEAWHEGELVGGVYGVSLGGYFAAESMFHHRRDASKAALAVLVEHLQRQGYGLLDIQALTPHLTRLGASTIPRREFLRRLESALAAPVDFGSL